MSEKWANFTIAQALLLFLSRLLAKTNCDRLRWTLVPVARTISRECDKVCSITKEGTRSQVWDRLLAMKIECGISDRCRRRNTLTKKFSDTRLRRRWIEFTRLIWRKSISTWWMRRSACHPSTRISRDYLKLSNKSSMLNSPATTKPPFNRIKIVKIKWKTGLRLTNL